MEPVVLRTGRGSLLIVVAAVGFVLVGLVAGFVTAVRADEVISVWGVLGLLALLSAGGLVLLVPRLVRPTTVTVSAEGYRIERGRAVVLDLPREQLTAVTLVREAQTTRIDLAHGGGVVSLVSGPRWREVVAVVRQWVAADPTLVHDQPSRDLLLGGAADLDRPRLPAGPLGLVRLALRERDPWVPFLPDAYGEHSRWFSGRLIAARADRRGSTGGLVWRWVVLLMVFVPVVVLAYGVVALLVVVADGDQAFEDGTIGQVVVLDQRA